MRYQLILSAFALLLGSCSTPPPEEPAAKPPNIIVFIADDLGYGDTGVYGSKFIKTPHIDQLAADGVRLTDAYVAAAVCSPSRAGLYTGRSQPRFGYDYNPTGDDTVLGLPTDERTLGNLMNDAGYATGLVGKWHLGKSEQHHPMSRGFDEYYGILSGGSTYIDSTLDGVQSWPNPDSPTQRPDASAVFDGRQQIEVEEYLTDVFAEEAVDYIARHKDEPFFLMLTPNAPHTPLQSTDEYYDRYPDIKEEGKRIFAAMVSSVDDYVGDVVAELKKHNIEDNTLMVFFSDNGCIAYMSEPICTNEPLSGSKRYHLEGGVRVPFIYKWPARLPKGQVYSQPVTSLDLYSTMAAAAGVDERTQDSVDLTPYLAGDNTEVPHEFLFWRAKPNMSVRWGKWKMWKVNKSDQPLSAMTLSGLRLPEIEFPQDSPNGQLTVLYDLSADIGEQTNVADQHPDVVERLETELANWDAELADETLWPTRRSTLTELHGEIVQLFY